MADSAKVYLRKAMKARLAADCLNDDNTPVVKTFLVYQGQFDHERNEQVILYPAVLFQYTSLQYKSQPTNYQTTDAIVTLHIATHGLASNDDQFDALMAVVEKIQFSLQGFVDSAGVFSVLRRHAERQTISRTNITVWEVDYTSFLRDLVASRFNRMVQATITALDITEVTDGDTKPRIVPIQS